MKIIAVSNFDNETKNDRLIAENIKYPYEAKIMVDALNGSSGEYSSDFFKAVGDDYELFVWEP